MEAFFWIMAGIIWLIYHLVKVYDLTPKNVWRIAKVPESGCLFQIILLGVPLIFAVVANSVRNSIVSVILYILGVLWGAGLIILAFLPEDREKKQNLEQEGEEDDEEEEEDWF